MHNQYPRLSLADRSSLRIERPATPTHIAGLCIVEAAPLLDEHGELDLAMIKRRLERRLGRAPALRHIVQSVPPLCGAPLWVDDPGFSIDRHVHGLRLDLPGDEATLLQMAELLLRPLLDRTHPLWELWFLTGIDGGSRIGVLFKVHHAVADGLAAVALIMALLDLEPTAPDPPAESWHPMPCPPVWALLGDNLACRLAAVRATLAHPVRLARTIGSTLTNTLGFVRTQGTAPRTSLNALPGVERRLRVVHLDLETAHAVAHAHGAKVNDVILSLVTGGVRDLLIARGEPVDGVELATSVPATLRSAEAARGELGNAAGALLVRLPAGEADAIRRLERIAATTRSAKAEQHPAYINGVFSWLAATRLAVPLAQHQRMVNFFVTNVPGPRVPLYVLGARVEEMIPILGLAGNVTLMFAALSYFGHLSVLVSADAVSFPDSQADLLAAGMQHSWEALVYHDLSRLRQTA